MTDHGSSEITDLVKEIVEHTTKVTFEVYLKKRFPKIKFPVKLMWILNDGRYKNILDWSVDGKSLTVTNRDDMEQVFLKALSGKVQLYSSFVKKLSRWGFKKQPNGGETYWHSEFRKDQPNTIDKVVVLGGSKATGTVNSTAGIASSTTEVLAPTSPYIAENLSRKVNHLCRENPLLEYRNFQSSRYSEMQQGRRDILLIMHKLKKSTSTLTKLRQRFLELDKDMRGCYEWDWQQRLHFKTEICLLWDRTKLSNSALKVLFLQLHYLKTLFLGHTEGSCDHYWYQLLTDEITASVRMLEGICAGLWHLESTYLSEKCETFFTY